MSKRDYTQESLLELDGTIISLDEKGHWVKFEAKRILKPGASKNRPHGIKYSLTLHNKNGDRIIGYDNAHRIMGKKNDAEYDHRHHPRFKDPKEYKYETAGKLVEDFWKDIDSYLNEG